MKNLRRLSQILFLALFLYLFIQTDYHGEDELGLPVRLFLDFDPLIALSAILATHAVRAVFLLALVTLVLSVFLGRFFCGWVCPLGTLNTAVGWFRMRRAGPVPEDGRYPRLRPIKYFVLVFVLVAALFGWNPAGFVDPISLTIRSLAIGYNPGFNKIVRTSLDAVYGLGWPGISPAADAVYSALVGTVLAFQQPFFRQMIPIALIFTAILLLNLLAPRFWCRYLCPLGALLGLAGTKQMLARVDVNCDKCMSCRVCNRSCQGDATPFPPGQWASRECVLCWNCKDACPCTAVRIGPTLKKTGEGNVDLGRRWLLASGAGALLSVPLVSLQGHREGPHPELIRPPGAVPEDEFLRRCVKCGECMKVCPTNVIQPTLHQAGLEGLWTPMLVPTLGYCEFNCTLCTQVCPTGAIERLELKVKQRTKIGLATVDRSRCIPWVHGRNCGVCEEHCPARGKAIRFQEEERVKRDGERFILKKPYVIPQICIGCGICENKCPVLDIRAIRVTSMNESRGEARIFL